MLARDACSLCHALQLQCSTSFFGHGQQQWCWQFMTIIVNMPENRENTFTFEWILESSCSVLLTCNAKTNWETVKFLSAFEGDCWLVWILKIKSTGCRYGESKVVFLRKAKQTKIPFNCISHWVKEVLEVSPGTDIATAMTLLT